MAYPTKLTDLSGTKAKYMETTGSSGGPTIKFEILDRDAF